MQAHNLQDNKLPVKIFTTRLKHQLTQANRVGGRGKWREHSVAMTTLTSFQGTCMAILYKLLNN